MMRAEIAQEGLGTVSIGPHQPDKRHIFTGEYPVARETADRFARSVAKIVNVDSFEIKLLEKLMGDVHAYLNKLNEGRLILKPADIEYLNSFFVELIAERNGRAQEAESMEIAQAIEIAGKLLPRPVYALICIDGRINLTVKFGFVGGMKGGSIQLPAGDPIEFVPSKNSEIILMEPSNMATQLRRALEADDVIIEVLDSHLGCAAQEANQNAIGNFNAPDKGLLADILRKKEISAAMQAFAAKCAPDGNKKIIPIQGAFDPHNGFSYAGLETDYALQCAREAGGFTGAVLDRLVKEGRVLSAQKIAIEFADVFQKEYALFGGGFDWRTGYKDTGLGFWQAVERMRPKLLPCIKDKLTCAGGPYEGLPDEDELNMRAMLLLNNAFNGFCNNKNGHYLFASHEESFVSVTPRDFRPFGKFTGFGVYDADTDTVAESVVFASGIVRKNRYEERVKASMYKTREEYARAPVAVIVKEVFRSKIEKEEWVKLQQINWNFLESTDWIGISDRAFQEALAANNQDVKIGIHMAGAILNLRNKMIALYNVQKESARHLINGCLVAMPVICDSSRRFQLFVPFFKKGFPAETK